MGLEMFLFFLTFTTKKKYFRYHCLYLYQTIPVKLLTLTTMEFENSTCARDDRAMQCCTKFFFSNSKEITRFRWTFSFITTYSVRTSVYRVKLYKKYLKNLRIFFKYSIQSIVYWRRGGVNFVLGEWGGATFHTTSYENTPLVRGVFHNLTKKINNNLRYKFT